MAGSLMIAAILTLVAVKEPKATVIRSKKEEVVIAGS
jgi:hypothetical protein